MAHGPAGALLLPLHVTTAASGITGTVAVTLDAFTSSATGDVVAPPAAPTVRGYSTPNNATDAAPAFTVNAPASVAAGDLLIAFAANDTTGTAWTTSPGNGWTKLSDEVQGSTHRLAVYALIADGTDGLSIAAANNQDYSVVMLAIQVGTHRVTNVSTDIVIPAAATGTTGNADPPNSGTVVSDVWLAIAACAVDLTAAGDSISAYPANYGNGVLTKSASSTSSVGLGVGHLALTATTAENPGTFTNTTNAWIAKTLLIPSANETGTVAVTLADFTSDASGTVATGITGTVAVTLDACTSSASGTHTPPPITGTAAITLADFTSSASGTFTASGITGTAAVTLANVTPSASGVVVNGDYPVAVSGNSRYLVDQHGDPWFGVGDTAWSLIAQLTTSEITTYLEDRQSKGVNLVIFNAPEAHFTSQTPDYNNVAGEKPFTGTEFQSSLTENYWTVVDHAVAEAARLGITCLITPAYLGFNDTEGWGAEVAAASNANLTSYGDTLATRYGKYPNIIWLAGHDRSPDATLKARIAALTDALQAGTSHLVTCGVASPSLGSDGWEGSGVDYDFDTAYDNSDATDWANRTALGWAATPTMPVGYIEARYEAEGGFANQYNDEPFIRAAMYGPLCAGATYIFFGNNPMWHFESTRTLFSYTGTWESNLDSPGSLKLEVFGAFVASMAGNWATMTPDTTDTFLTSGEGTGATRAAARFDGTTTTGIIAIAYRPNSGSSSLTFDLTELDQVANVRVRKFDPFDGTYTTINTYATTGSQAIGSLGTNGAGDGDWVLVFDPSIDVSGTVTVTLANVTSAASGTATPPSFTGTVAVTLADFTGSASGTSTPPAFTGTATPTLDAATSNASGTSTPPAVTGSAAVTLDAVTSSASGTVSGAGEITGTVAVTLVNFTASASGTFTAPAITGTAGVTLAVFTSSADGASTPPQFTGTSAGTLANFASTATGTVGLPAFTGTAAATLAPFTSTGTGTFVPPPITGTVAVTLSAFVGAIIGFVGALATFTGPATTARADDKRSTGRFDDQRTTRPIDGDRTTEVIR